MCVHDPEAEVCGAPQFGAYHQQYWLDGEKLIAVGVVVQIWAKLVHCIGAMRTDVTHSTSPQTLSIS
ncbi:hypothetical protein TcWFU_009730 [Taenia crassiceps]|uniref:Uncharacterized protein n=1 Tax=Taenia crassiceps TaxID=6207 RepID=A0ABR4QT81_9CEST